MPTATIGRRELLLRLLKMKILVAEDDDVTRLLLSSTLRKLGHDVHGATNGREAWEAWHAGEFSLVISDWMMPDLDGLEFCRRIRAERRADYTYIVLLTSRSGKTNYLEAMTAGADDFITKPFEKDAFAARVRVPSESWGCTRTCAQPTPISSVASVNARQSSPPRCKPKANFSHAPATSCARP
jgi:DNA-binding response OmpR family regulator